MQIANTLHRSPGSIRDKAQRLRDKGVLKAIPQSGSIKPDRQDFDEVKMNYCRKNHITTAELYSRFESDDQLAAELYRRGSSGQADKVGAQGRMKGYGKSVIECYAGCGSPRHPALVALRATVTSRATTRAGQL